MKCIACGKTINLFAEVCPYCGEAQYDDEAQKRPRPASGQRVKRGREETFTDEEILALGLYLKDEGYKMSLISKILDK